MFSFTEVVRAARRELGSITQEELARKLQVSLGAVRNWESGRKRPAPKQLRALSALVPKLSKPIRELIHSYDWHPKKELRGLHPMEAIRRSNSGRVTFSEGPADPVASAAPAVPTSPQKRPARRYSPTTIMAAHEALDIVLDNAPSSVVEKVQALIEKHAAQWRKE